MEPAFGSLFPNVHSPLRGKRILVTAPGTYAARLLPLLIQRGGRPIYVPVVEDLPLTDTSHLDRVVATLHEYDWAIFCSRNAIRTTLDRLQKLRCSIDVFKGCRTVAIGKDADALQDAGVTVDMIPKDSSLRGIADEFRQFPSRARVVVFTPAVVGMPEPNVIPNFVQELVELGFDVSRTDCYMLATVSHENERELDFVGRHGVDIAIFTSSIEIEGLMLAFPRSKDILNQAIILCFGPKCGETASHFGIPVHVLPRDTSSFGSLVSALEHYLDVMR